MSSSVPCAPSKRIVLPAFHVRAQAGESSQHFFRLLHRVEGRQAEFGEDLVRLRGAMGDHAPEISFVQQVGDAQAATIDLIGVGGADAPLGGADLAIAQGRLAGGVQLHVERQDNMLAV